MDAAIFRAAKGLRIAAEVKPLFRERNRFHEWCVPCLADSGLQTVAAPDMWWQALSHPLTAFQSRGNLCGVSQKCANAHSTRKKGTEINVPCRIGRIEGILRVIGADAADPERVQRAEAAVANLMQQLAELQKSEGPLSEQARHMASPLGTLDLARVTL